MYETNVLTLSPVTVGIMRQISQALLHKEVYLDGVKYVISDVPEAENYGQTNLVVIIATMIKDGNVYNSEVDGNGISADSGLEIVGLIKNANKYITLN